MPTIVETFEPAAKTTVETFEPVQPKYVQQLGGAFVRGGMKIGEALLRLPEQTTKQFKFLNQANYANLILGEPDPKIQKQLRKEMYNSGLIYDKVADLLAKPGELHKQGQESIIRNHPEWVSEPPKSFIDLFTHPSKLGVALAESTPILLGAGILSAAGAPHAGVLMMYTTEGQQAYDLAIEDGASEQDAAIAYGIYGSVSAALEQMQLEGIIKVAKGMYNGLLNRTVQKVGQKGLKALTYETIKIGVKESLEEMSQGTWQEWTAKTVYDKSIPGGVAGFIDRRAQEGYIAFMMGLIPGGAGAVTGKIAGLTQMPTAQKVALMDTHLQDFIDEVDKSGLTTEQKELTKLNLEQQAYEIREELKEKYTDIIVKDEKTATQQAQRIIKDLGFEDWADWKIKWLPNKKLSSAGSWGSIDSTTKIIEVPLKYLEKTTGQLQWFGPSSWYWTGGPISHRASSIQIENKTPGKFNQDLFKAFICHEMVHPYAYRTGKFSNRHTKAFARQQEKWRKETMAEEKVITKTPIETGIWAPAEAPVEAVGAITPVEPPVAAPGDYVDPITGRISTTRPDILVMTDKKFEIIPPDLIIPPNQQAGQPVSNYAPNSKILDIAQFAKTRADFLKQYKEYIFKLFNIDVIQRGQEKLGVKLTSEGLSKAQRNFYNEFLGRIGENFGSIDNFMSEAKRVVADLAKQVPTKPKPPAAAKGEPEEKPLSRKKQIGIIRGLAKKLEMSDEDRFALQEKLTGIKSSGKMTPEQRDTVIEYLRGILGKPYEFTKEDEAKTIDLGGTVGIKSYSEIFKNIIDMVRDLPSKVKEVIIPITRRMGEKTFEEGIGELVGDYSIGKDNSVLSNLAFWLSGKKPSLLTHIFKEYEMWQERVKSDIVVSTLKDYVIPRLRQMGISADDAAKMSNSVNPQSYLIQTLQKYLGVGTEMLSFEINGRIFNEVNWGELVGFYLTTEREESLFHLVDERKNLLQLDYLSDEFRERIESGKNIKGGGTQFLFHSTKTKTHPGGGIPVEKIIELRQLVQGNPKALALARLWKTLDIDIFKPRINETSQKTIGEDIATTPNWYPQDAVVPKGGKLSGKEVTVDAEFKRFLFTDTNSTRQLRIKDFFDVLVDTINKVADYNAKAEITRLIRTILNDKNLGDMWEEKGYGKARTNMITILRNAQTPASNPGAFDKFFNRMLPQFYQAVLLNVRSWVSQFSSTAAYGAYIDLKYFKVVPNMFTHLKEYWKEALDNDSVLYQRFLLGRSTIELGLTGVKDTTFSAIQGKISGRGPNKLGIPMKVFDFAAMLIGRRIAIAEYLDAQKGIIQGESAEWWADKNTEWKEKSNEWNRLICDRCDYLWRTQSQWNKWRQSVNLSRPMGFWRALFMFRSAHEALLNTLQEATWEFQAGAKTSADVARLSRKWGSVMASYAIDTIFRNVILIMLTGRLKRPWEYVVELVGNPLDMIAILGKVIFQITSNFVGVLEGEPLQYRGRALEAPPLAILQQLFQAPINFAQAAAFYIRGDPDQGYTSLKRAVNQLYEGAGVLYLGMPVYEFRRIMRSEYVEAAIGEEEGPPQGRRARGRRARSRR